MSCFGRTDKAPQEDKLTALCSSLRLYKISYTASNRPPNCNVAAVFTTRWVGASATHAAAFAVPHSLQFRHNTLQQKTAVPSSWCTLWFCPCLLCNCCMRQLTTNRFTTDFFMQSNTTAQHPTCSPGSGRQDHKGLSLTGSAVVHMPFRQATRPPTLHELCQADSNPLFQD